MATLSANGITLTYSTSSNDTRVTITLSSLVKNSDPTSFISRNVRLLVDGKTIVSRQSAQTPSTKKILQGYNSSGFYTESQKIQAEADRKNRQRQNGIFACSQFVSAFSSKTLTFNRTNIDKKVIISLYVLGKNSAVSINVPKKASEEGSTREESKTIGIENVNGGVSYVVNEQAYNTYGHIERVVDFADVKDELQLLSLANAYVNAMQFDDMCLSVSAVDLHTLMGSVPGFELLDNVKCVSRPHGLNKTFPITEMSIPLDDPSRATYTFGKLGGSSMSQTTASNASDITKRINKMPSASRILDSAKIEMSEILNSRTTGYVNIVQENDISQALIISDTPDWTNADKLWKFDMNGLGYSDDTITGASADINADGRFYKIGITMDGTIVADFIKTGLLEDGIGKNYWNLSTGEFSLSADTQFYTPSDTDPVLTTLADLSASADKIEEAYQKSNGNSNILKNTGTVKFKESGSHDTGWRYGTFSSFSANKVTIINILDSMAFQSPNPVITSCFRVDSKPLSAKGWGGGVQQDGVPVSPNTTYIAGCYACGSGPVSVQVGYLARDGVTYYRRYVQQVDSTGWSRISIVFKTSNDKQPSVTTINNKITARRRAMEQALATYNGKKASKGAGDKETIEALAAYKAKKKSLDEAITEKNVYDSTLYLGNYSTNAPIKNITVTFGVYCSNSDEFNMAHQVDLCGFFLARGNAYEDWQPSNIDIIERSRMDTDAMLTQAEILKRLRTRADGTLANGLFMKNGNLYIGAEYIDTTAQSTKLLTANYIQDKQNMNYWNLTDGTFRTKNMVADNARVYGTYSGGKLYQPYGAKSYKNASMTGIVMGGSTIDFKGIRYDKNGKRLYDLSTSVIRGAGANGYAGLTIASRGPIVLLGSSLATARPDYYHGKYHAALEYGQTVNLTFSGYYKHSKTKKMTYGRMYTLCFVNGLLVWIYHTRTYAGLSRNDNPYNDPRLMSAKNRNRGKYIKQYDNACMTTYLNEPFLY